MGVLGHHSFLYKAQNNYINKQLAMNNHLFIFLIWYVTDISSDTIFKPIGKVLSLGFDDCN